MYQKETLDVKSWSSASSWFQPIWRMFLKNLPSYSPYPGWKFKNLFKLFQAPPQMSWNLEDGVGKHHFEFPITLWRFCQLPDNKNPPEKSKLHSKGSIALLSAFLGGHCLEIYWWPRTGLVMQDIRSSFHPTEPRKKPGLTFHCTGCLIGILIMVYYNPHITG